MVGTAALVAVVFWQNPGAHAPETAPPASHTLSRASNVEIAAGAPPAATPAPAAPSGPPAAPQPPAVGAAAERPARMTSFAVASPPAPAASPASAAAAASPNAGSATNVAFKGETIVGGRAGRAMDLVNTLMPGLYKCTLDVAISSERSGPFFCHTTDDIKSPGRVTLMEAGTVIQGSYQSDVRPGQARILSMAAVATTPNGIPVPLGAPVGDALGRIGMEGAVNRHVMEKFGAATFLLLGQGAISSVQAALQGLASSGGGNTFLNLQTGSVQSVVAEVLRGNIGIQNTVEVNQGEEIAFLVTAPISFADSYRLRPR
ncbi:hypothetical protein GCM10009416_11540 [Craurococcus roseus]|uniref:Uncharacterized protein n=1 Tax=Craurococcus roseus TaxID=77585 RepID=A0ABP3PX10_9PROT